MSHLFIFHRSKVFTWSCVCERWLANVEEQAECFTLLPLPQGLLAQERTCVSHMELLACD